MKLSVLLLLGSATLLAASCDTAELPPTPDPDPAVWTLGDCIDAPGVAALFIGGPDLTCLPEAGETRESSLDTLGNLGGGIYFHSRGGDALLVLDDRINSGLAHTLDLRTGAVSRLSVAGTADSHVSRAGTDRYLIADYLDDISGSDTARFAFTFVEGSQTRTTLRIVVPDIGEVGFLEGDYDATSNTSALLFVTNRRPAVFLLAVDHGRGTYRVEDMSYAGRPSSVRYRPDGSLIVLDPITGRVYSVGDGGSLVLDMGPERDEMELRKLFEDSAGEVYTFTNGPAGARVLKLGAGGTEEVVALDRPQRYMYVSPSADVVCLREFHPIDFPGATYDDVISLYDLRTDALTTRRVTLRTDYYEFPLFACL
jgi:hypothetical protein